MPAPPVFLVALGLAASVLLAACGPSDYAGEMRAQHDGDTPAASGATAGADTADVTVERVVYGTVDGQTLTGTIARPAGAGPTAGLPGVVVIHEWWGLNENVEDMARRLADEGYAALAVDLYGGETAATPDEAMSLVRSAMADEEALTENLQAAYRFLASREEAPRVGVIGWCFGGMWSLRAALALPDELDAAVVYYGGPVTDADRLAPLDMPVLAFFGEDDSSIPQDTVRAFETALAEADVEHEVEVYPGAGHAFANPSGENYVPAAAEDAWRRTTAFLADNLKDQ
ncbi:dienelactone hydrolase family protein [Rubrivirga sp. S365]|uniref:Dienelactone hydrolase family protein n=1 Tax=Rubrivirga litoralis TaxID=3075598 RepID=A0ABU3BUY8_9BACT|nr:MULTISPECIES: dienelactone hydrolase family protein [unclassified Rubrivirga]MDT0633107.1 dienelactone hydrolase family protein [Rubrivirga sp. F394]MDT7857750.1 dienelactone hydrolase family protein [Rubrivirga sp. S365]